MSSPDDRPTIPVWSMAGQPHFKRVHGGATGTRLHILMPSHGYPPIGGGASAACHSLARQYVQAGHRVCVVTMGCGDLPEHERVEGIEVHRVACGRERRDMASPWEGITWARRSTAIVRRLDQRDPFDVVHAHFIMPGGIIGARLKNRFGTPLIITAHGTDVPGYNRARLKIAHVLAHPWWRQICRTADVIVSPSHDLAGLIEAHMRGLAVHVIPNGFDPQRFRPAAKQQRILLCGRLVARKGFQDFLTAIRSVELPGWHIDLVGDGPMYDELTRLAATCRTPVTLHGWLDNDSDHLATLYGQAMIMVLPSRCENYSMALLEAMSAGCAVIATNLASNPDVIGDCGVRVPTRDLDGLRNAVVKLTRDPHHCQELGTHAMRRAKIQFDWTKLTRRYLDLFHGQLARRGAA